MTDNEIIKALEADIDPIERLRCSSIGVRFDVLKNVLDLINRQRVEIKRWEYVNKCDEQLINSLNKRYILAKSEAIKEFAERLKESMRLEDDCEYDCGQCRYGCKEYVPIIDNLAKEMAEENE